MEFIYVLINYKYRSMIETANAKTNTKLSDAQLDRMVDQMFSLAGMEGKSSLKFEDFQKLFHQNGDLLNDVSLDWKGEFRVSSAKYQ